MALDGDADRLQMVDASGRLYNGDELLYLMVADRLSQRVAVPGVVGTLMTNMAVELALRRIKFVRAKVGDRYILEELAAVGGNSAGKARATCWRWTSTRRAMAWSAHCRYCRLSSEANTRCLSCSQGSRCFRKP